MKIFLFILLTMNAQAEVSYEDCLADAKTYAHHLRPVAPLPECSQIIDSSSGRIEAKLPPYRAFGKDHVLYLEKQNPEGKLIERSLLAGDQTELGRIQKIFIDPEGQRLFVIQMNQQNHPELLVYRLNFLGNVSPLNVVASDALFTSASSVRMVSPDKIEVKNSQGTILINADAETRTSRSVRKAITALPQ